MKIYLSNHLAEQIAQLEQGAKIYGTFNKEHQVATICALETASQSTDNSRQFATLAVIGADSNRRYPLSWTAAHGWQTTDKTAVCEEIIYENSDFYKRTPFDPEVMSHVSKEKVLIVGVGSVGAPMGLELAKAGVGQVVALDKDILEIHNCMRHTLGTSYIGWPKAIAFAEYLKVHAPSCHCVPVYGDLFSGERQALKALIEKEKPTRILAVTDNREIQYICQMLALAYQIPLMAVWCDSNAIEGEIFLWEPGQAKGWKEGKPKRGCYGCLRLPDKASITRSAHFDYSSDDPDSYGGEPALGLFINRIANIAAIWMQAWMLSSCPTKTQLGDIMNEHYEKLGLQYIRLGGPYKFDKPEQPTAKQTWAPNWLRVIPRDECPFCQETDSLLERLFPEKITDTENWERVG